MLWKLGRIILKVMYLVIIVENVKWWIRLVPSRCCVAVCPYC